MNGFMKLLLLEFMAIVSNNRGFITPDGGGEGGSGDGNGEGEGGGGEADGNQGGSGDDGGAGSGDGDGNNDFDSLPDWAKKQINDSKKEIGDLRKENAGRRTSNKDLSDRFSKLEGGLKKAFGIDEGEEGVDLSEQVSGLTEQLEATQFNSAITEMAYENDVPKDKISFLKFRLNEALGNVADGEELPEEVLSGIIQEVKGVGKGQGDTGDGEGGRKPNDDESKNFDSLKVEAFVRMSDSDKNKLFKTDRAKYDSLHIEAKQKRLYK